MNSEIRAFLINRFDHYYDTINNKGNVFLAVNIFLVGGLFGLLSQLSKYLESETLATFCIVSMLALNVASIIFTLLSIVPYATTCGKSLIYFGDIAKLDLKTFRTQFSSQTKENLEIDLDQQVYYLAKGLNKKFKNLFIAGILFFIEAAFLLPLIISVITNLK